MAHRPIYASARSDWPVGTPAHVQAAFEELFHSFGVDLYIAGDKHYYERTGVVCAG